MNKILFFSILEGIYLYFMFNVFKTNIDINNPIEYIITSKNNYLKHPITTGIYQNKICPLGNLAGKLLFIWLIIRNFITNEKAQYLNNIFLKLTLVLSFIMNWNAFTYFLPVYIIDKYIF